MGDGVRRIARAFYERARLKEKMEARELFEKLDVNNDGKISLREFIKGFESGLTNERVFKEVGSNKDGTLNFDDVLLLFYYKKNAITIPQCDACCQLILTGPSFSCFECLCNNSNDHCTYTLCCNCYGKGKFQHSHPLLHDQALLLKLAKLTTNDPKALAKKEMKKLVEIAKSHYNAASPQVKAKADDFFKSMDADGDNEVELEEFLAFMREQGYTHMHNNQFFKELDVDGNGSLGFWEVMTLYYIIKSGRPFCDRCGDFIPEVYFSCVLCFESAETNSFNICHACYESHKCKHSHHGRPALFLDNYTLLLQATQDSAPTAKTAFLQTRQDDSDSSAIYKKKTITDERRTNASTRPPTSTAIVAKTKSTASTHHTHYPNRETSSQAIVPALRVAVATFKVLEMAITVGSLSANMCTIL